MNEIETEIVQALQSGDEDRIQDAAESLKRVFRNPSILPTALEEPIHSRLLELCEIGNNKKLIPFQSAAISILSTAQDHDPRAVFAAINCLKEETPQSVSNPASSLLLKSSQILSTTTNYLEKLGHIADSSVISALRIAELARDCQTTAIDWTEEFLGSRLSNILEKSDQDITAALNAAEILSDGNWPKPPPLKALISLINICKTFKTKASLIVDASIRAIGIIASRNQESFQLILSNDGINCITSLIPKIGDEIANDGIVEASISAISWIASSNPFAFNQINQTSALNNIVEIGSLGRQKQLRLVAIHSLAEIIEMSHWKNVGNWTSPESQQLSKSLQTTIFDKVLPSPMAFVNTLVASIKNPLEEISCAALHFIRSIANHGWGLKTIRNSAGALEILTDRNLFAVSSSSPQGSFDNETAMVAKRLREWRFGVIKAAVDCIQCEESIGSEWFAKLQRFVQQGAHFISPKTTVDWRRENH